MTRPARRMDADGVTDRGTGTPPEDGVTFSRGRVSVVATGTEQGPTVASLIAAGRMRGDSGAFASDAARLRSTIALVDTPGVCDPPDRVRLTGVVREELMLARRPSGRRDARAFLDSVGAASHARSMMRDLPPGVRLRVLSELAALRPGITGIVITSPERHGGTAREWREIADSLAARSFAVLVVTSHAGRTAHVSRTDPTLLARATPRRRRYLTSAPPLISNPPKAPTP